MNLTLDYLKSNRKWLVKNLLVWGNAESVRTRMILTEISSPKRIMYSESSIGGKNQTVNFADLVDSRGNQLPDEINNPIVIIIPRNNSHCYLIGQPSKTGFAIGRENIEPGTASDGLVDLLIMEVDLP